MKNLQHRIQQLKQEHESEDLRPLIQKVAWVLFFEFDIPPTGNKIHALLKQGSMTTHTSEVHAFWKNVKDVCQGSPMSLVFPFAKNLSKIA